VIALIEVKVLPHFTSRHDRERGRAQLNRRARTEGAPGGGIQDAAGAHYSSALAAYSNQKFEFRPLRAKPTDTDVTVNVRVLQSAPSP